MQPDAERHDVMVEEEMGRGVVAEIADAHSYQPETRDMLRQLAVLAYKGPKALTRSIFQGLFGDPAIASHLVSLWLRTTHRYAGPGNVSTQPADVLRFLASAPAVPCLRYHHIGGRERHDAYFFPFGVHETAAHLFVPLAHADPRLLRAVALLVTNPWAFTQADEDPVFGCITFSSFRYTEQAQAKLEACRPVLMAAAVRSIAAQTRLEAARSERAGPAAHNMPRPLLDRHILGQPPTFVRAVLEARVLEKIRKRGPAAMAAGASQQLLSEAMRFVLDEEKGRSRGMPPNNRFAGHANELGSFAAAASRAGGVPSQAYPVLPSDEEIRRFGRQVETRWLRARKRECES